MSLIGTTVGRIQILETLGRGGMGEVFLGWDDTLKRKVALKAINDDRRLDTETKARFLREARILSQLDHPGICRIHGLVESDDHDFLVLELIDGSTLRQALADELEPWYKLHVAEKVAEALVAAHAKGVAHRDLKPENVMLTADGGVKVLDFGLAYTVGEDLAALAAGDGGGLDGGGLGEGGLGGGGLDGGGLDPSRPVSESRRDSGRVSRTLVMSEPPPAESGLDPAASLAIETEAGTIMGTVAYMSPEQAQGERATTASDIYSFGLMLQELFTGEWAYERGHKFPVMMLKVASGETRPVSGVDPDLAELITRMKDPAPAARPTAIETVERLRWLRGKPRRRWIRLAAAAAVATLTLGGLKFTLDLKRQEQAAIDARDEAEQVTEFLVDLFSVANPDTAAGQRVTAQELLDAGAARIRALELQPLVRARLMLTMGRAYRQLGLYSRALPYVEEALELHRQEIGEDHLDTASSLDLLANLYHDRGDYALAEPLFLRALDVRKGALGDRHPHVAASLNNLAFLYQARGDPGRAEPLFLEALAILEAEHGAEHPDVARSLNNLGNLYRDLGDLVRAEPYLRRAVETQTAVLGAGHPRLAVSLNNLAMIYHEQGALAEAEPLYRQALEIFERTLGSEHADVASGLNNLAELYRRIGAWERAEPLYRRALAIQEQALGGSHPLVAVTLSNLADLHAARGEVEPARSLFEKALKIQEGGLGASDPGTAITLHHLADLFAAAGEDARAEPLYRRALTIQEQILGADHRATTASRADLGGLLRRQGRLDEAASHLGRAFETAEAAWSERQGNRFRRLQLATILVELGRLYEARGEARRAAESLAGAVELTTPLATGSEIIGDLHVHAVALLELGRPEEARPAAELLLARGWSRPDFLELCRRHGLMGSAGPAGVNLQP